MEVVLRSLIVAIFACSFVHGIPYSPECQALDEMINAASSSLINGLSMQCNKTRECTGLGCGLTYMDQTTFVSLRLHHCRVPPSMDFRIYSSDGTLDYKRNITHGDIFELPNAAGIPGLESLIGGMKLYIKVDFQPGDGGITIGLSLQAGISEDLIMFDQPILEDHFIPTPPCTGGPSLDPHLKEVQCRHMREVMQNLPSQDDMDCFVGNDCMGINCTGKIEEIPVTTYLEIGNCDDPVSLTLYVVSDTVDLAWQHTYTQSEVAQIDDLDYEVNGFPVLVQLPLEMQPPRDGYMLTSLAFKGCVNSGFGLICPDYYTVHILDNTLIPVPPCYRPKSPGEGMTLPPVPPSQDRPHFPTYPSSAPHSECQALDDMIRQLSRKTEDGHMMSCYRNNNCTGFNCSAVYMGDDYEVYFGIHHCQHPVEVVLAVASHNQGIRWQQTFTDGKTVPIQGLTQDLSPFGMVQVYLEVDLKKESFDLVISLILRFGFKTAGIVTYLPGTDMPLVQDERIPLPTCDGSTRPPPPPHGGGETGKPGDKPDDKPDGKPDGKEGDKQGVGQSTPATANDAANVHAGKAPPSSHSTAIIVGVVVSVVVLGAGLLTFYLVRRYKCIKAGDTTLILDNSTKSSSIL